MAAIDRALHLLHQAQTVCLSLTDARHSDRSLFEQQRVPIIITCIYMAGKLENCYRTLRNLLQVAISLHHDVMKQSSLDSHAIQMEQTQLQNRWRNEVSLWERFLLLRLSSLGVLRQPTCTQITVRMLSKCDIGSVKSHADETTIVWDQALQLCLMVDAFTSGKICSFINSKFNSSCCLCAPVKAVLVFCLLLAHPHRRLSPVTLRGHSLHQQLVTIVNLLSESTLIPISLDGSMPDRAITDKALGKSLPYKWIYQTLPQFEKYFGEHSTEGPMAFFHDVHMKIRQTTLKCIENGLSQQLTAKRPPTEAMISGGPPIKRSKP